MEPIKQISLKLAQSGCQYALYVRQEGSPAVLYQNAEVFRSASIIKLPMLLAWAALEKEGQLDRRALCNLDAEPEVHGSGISWLLAARQIPYQDVLLMMIALSDNLCTNLVIRHIGLERIQRVFTEQLHLRDTQLQRRLMDYAARDEGKDNFISAGECIRLFDCFHGLAPDQKAWVEPMLEAAVDAGLLKRDIPRDTVDFYHKTGSMEGVLHDWGYTRSADIFLLTQQVDDEVAAARLFGELGRMVLR